MRLFLLFVVLFPCIAFAQDAVDPFRSTAYPLPRFAALASNEIYVRAGPGKQYPVQWVFKKAGLPVEIVLEFDHWRKIKDYEGASGWVHKSLLSGRRTAIVKPLNDGLKKENMPLFSNENIESKKLAELQPGVVVDIIQCDGDWCRVDAQGYKGWLHQERLWGIYPDETVDD